MRRAARERARLPSKLALWGGDRDAAAVEGARENLAAAGLVEHVRLEVAEALDLAPRRGWNAWIVSNLPYGERVGGAARLAPLFRSFGALLRERCAGYRAALLSGDPALSSALALPAPARTPLKNGGLDCELLQAQL